MSIEGSKLLALKSELLYLSLRMKRKMHNYSLYLLSAPSTGQKPKPVSLRGLPSLPWPHHPTEALRWGSWPCRKDHPPLSRHRHTYSKRSILRKFLGPVPGQLPHYFFFNHFSLYHSSTPSFPTSLDMDFYGFLFSVLTYVDSKLSYLMLITSLGAPGQSAPNGRKHEFKPLSLLLPFNTAAQLFVRIENIISVCPQPWVDYTPKSAI